MEPSFHPAQPADTELLLGLMRKLYARDGYSFEEGTARTALEGLVRDPGLGRVWVIGRDEEAIGYLVLTFGYSLEYGGRDAFVDELFVAAGHRHRGVGTRAIEFAAEQCRAVGVRALHLEVERANAVAQALYRKAGFEDHDRSQLTRRIAR